MEVSPIVKLFKSDFGPSAHIFKRLDTEDIINLSICLSSNKKDVNKNIQRIKTIRHLGRRIETREFNINLLSSYFRDFMNESVHLVNTFDFSNITSESLQNIDNHIYYRKYSIRRILDNDIDIIYQHLKYGETINRDIFTTIILIIPRQSLHFHFNSIIDIFIKYNQTHPKQDSSSLVDHLISTKTLSLIVLSHKDHRFLYMIYIRYGKQMVREIMDHIWRQERRECLSEDNWIDTFEQTIMSDNYKKYLSIESDIIDGNYYGKTKQIYINTNLEYFLDLLSFYKFMSHEYNLSTNIIDEIKEYIYMLEEYREKYNQ